MTPSKRRRRHEIASWWTPQPVRPAAVQPHQEASNGKDSIMMDEKARCSDCPVPPRESMAIHLLKEGENWVVIQNRSDATNDEADRMQISIVHDASLSLCLDNGALFGHCHGRSENATNVLDHKHDQRHGSSENCMLQALPVLCIDVDSTAPCITVKDIRRGKSQVVQTGDDPNRYSNQENDSHVANCLTFSLLRRKRQGNKVQKVDNMNHADREPRRLAEQDGLASASDDAHSSGYTTDDEKDDCEDMEEGTNLKKNHDVGTQIENDLPPEETDVDSEGNSLYLPPEWLPPRQIRVLKDGDRLVIRYMPSSMTTDNASKNCDIHSHPPRIAKLEYIDARRSLSHPRRSRNSQHRKMKEMKCTMMEKTQGKPRLLSVKSDVKSECKKKFTLNSTSAAEAPSDDEVSIKATKGREHHNQKKREHNGNARAIKSADAVRDYFCKKNYEMHKAGKDWSAVESVMADAVGVRDGGNKDKNACRNNDDDDGMEEYSYLTGEIVMKDQDYISALTGDEAIVPPPGQSNNKEGHRGETEHYGAEIGTNAVVGHSSSPATKSKKNEQFKEVSFDAKCRSPEKASPNKPTEEDDYVEPGYNENVHESNESAEGAHKEAFQTAQSYHDDEDGHSAEGELEILSQANADSSPEKGSCIYDDVTDVSQTQSLPFIKTAKNNTEDCSQSLSDVDEGKEEDDSTTGPDSPDKKGASGRGDGILPFHVEARNSNEAFNQNGDNIFSQSTTMSPKLNSQYADEAYNAETQFVQAPSPLALNYHSDHEIYNAETQCVGPITVANNDFVGEEKIDDAEVDDAVINSAEPPFKSAEVPLKSENATDPKLSNEEIDQVHEPPIIDVMALAESPRGNVAADNIETLPTVTKPSSRRRATYENSRLLGDDAIHQIRNGAIMTGSVGGSNLGLSVARGNTDRDLLTSIALQSTPNTLPEVPMSSEETTVVNDRETAAHLNEKSSGAKQKNSSRRLATNVPINDMKDSNDRPMIPAEVCFVEEGGEGNNVTKMSRASFTPPRHRSKRICHEDTKRSPNDEEKVRIMFTGIEISSKHKKMIQSIGAEVVESLEQAASATHVIASDGKTKLRRTPKLMICICKTSNILSIDWLEQSASQQKILKPTDFLVLGDKAAEAAYNFSMKETLENGQEARRNGGVLGGYCIYICDGVADNNAPPLRALQLIIEAAGGQVSKALGRRCDHINTIILTSDPSTNAQLSEKGVARAASQGAKIRTTSWLFHTIITQRFSLDAGCSHSLLEKSKSMSKRKTETSSPSSSTKRRRYGRR